jgi:hypothetical protein
MGMFNSIVADLRCATTQEVATDTEIQIKCQARGARALTVYHPGDLLDGIEAQYDNTWIQTDYVCRACSRRTTGKDGITYIKTGDQQRHPVFVRIAQGRIRDVLTEDEFKKLSVTDLVHDF